MDTQQTGGILITGGTGYLGGELVRQALRLGMPIAATYFSQQPPRSNGIRWIPLDIRESLSVEETLDQLRPAIVIHTAYRQRDPGLWAISAEGARTIAAASRASGARLVHMSTDALFDGTVATAYTEQDAPSPVNDYGRAKAAAEAFVAEIDPHAAIVRTSLIYGFHPIDMHTRFVLRVADGQEQAILFRDEIRCPIFVGDLAAAVLEVAQTDWRGVINIAGAQPLSRYDFGRLLARAHGRDPERLQSGLSAESGMNRPRNCPLDISLARRTLRTPLRGVEEVL